MANWGAGGKGALSGGMTGASIGTAILPGWGTAIGGAAGAIGGGLLGLFSGGGSGDAAKAQHESLDAAMKRLQEFSAQQYQNRQRDLAQTLAFYGPAERYLQSIYAQPQGTVAGPAPRGMPGAPGGGLPTPPGFPKQMPTDPTLNYQQGPRRGF